MVDFTKTNFHEENNNNFNNNNKSYHNFLEFLFCGTTRTGYNNNIL